MTDFKTSAFAHSPRQREAFASSTFRARHCGTSQSASATQYNRLLDPALGVEDPANDGLTRFETRARFDFTPEVYLTLTWVTNLTFTTLGNTNHTGFAESSSR